MLVLRKTLVEFAVHLFGASHSGRELGRITRENIPVPTPSLFVSIIPYDEGKREDCNEFFSHLQIPQVSSN